MKDERSKLEKILWDVIGEPLYYCSECLRAVHVKTVDGEVIVKRNCSHDSAQIIAPRKAMLSGKGFAGLKPSDKAGVLFSQVASKITGRNI